MSELMMKEQKAIERLRAFEPEDGYYLAYSGGKDSDCIKILATLAGIKFEAVHNLTSVDAPETVRYVKNQPDVKINLPRDKDGKHITMWNLIVKNLMPPTRIARYCCEKLKETGGKGRLVVTGVRWAESPRRKEQAGIVTVVGAPKTNQNRADEYNAEYQVTKAGGLIMNDDNDPARRTVEHCYRTSKTMLNPIVDWTDDEVWQFLNHHGCAGNPLYQCRFTRIGCIGCPMAGGRGQKSQFARWPKYRENYVRTFERMLAARKTAGKPIGSWRNGEDVMRWWVGDDPNQICVDDMEVEL